MAYEASEIMCASALLYSNNQLDKYSKDYEGLVDLVADIKKKVQNTQLIEFGNASIKKGFTDLIDEKNDKIIKDMAVGISVKGLENTLTSKMYHLLKFIWQVMYCTDVQKFQVSAFGMKDYNSSDLMYIEIKSFLRNISQKET